KDERGFCRVRAREVVTSIRAGPGLPAKPDPATGTFMVN
ncbi:MAG: hypothetical protein RL077_3423, partial [Verrucomicrobiota bacterium]